jgi:hypothetical protein
MSAINQLAQVVDKIAEATALIAQLQALLPALTAAVSTEAAGAEAPVPNVAGAEAPVPNVAGAETPVPKVKKAKKTKVAPAEDVASKPKKPASDGTMAWHAFVKHVQEEQPTRFAELKKHSDVLHEAKSIREEDEAGYKAFISSWKASHLSEAAVEEPPALEEIVMAPASAVASAVADVKEKRKVAAGTMAWHAFVTHCKTTMPELAALSKSSEKLVAIKERKNSDKAGYESFVNEWKAAQPVA